MYSGIWKCSRFSREDKEQTDVTQTFGGRRQAEGEPGLGGGTWMWSDITVGNIWEIRALRGSLPVKSQNSVIIFYAKS